MHNTGIHTVTDTVPYIPYGKQDINQDDINAVIEVLKSDYLTQGPCVPKFEESVANYCGAEYGVAVNSATSALHIACLALGLGKGEWLWTSPNTFVASANCAMYCGANVDFVDIDPSTYNLCPNKLEKKLKRAKAQNRLPRIVIPVHFAGQSCDMKRIYELSQAYDFKIIEDASHAIGGRYLDRTIGGCQYSDITVFSFHPVKIITTAEGGLATTNHPELASKMQGLRSHGITREPQLMTHESDGDWYYQQIELGFNYRMTELQAALGLSQMKRLDEFVERRHQLANRYDKLLEALPVIRPIQSKDSYSSFHLYPLQLELNKTQKTRKEIFNELRKSRIGVHVMYIPVHTQPFYNAHGFKEGDFPCSEEYYKRVINLPIHYSMTNDQQDFVVSALININK